MIRQFIEFCEDNNHAPPAPMREVRPRDELTYWAAGDPALTYQADPAVEMRAESGRAVYVQRIVWEIRYLLLLENGDEFERGMIPDLGTALEVARVWLAGGGMDDLPKARRFIL
ncbi:MAG: hypothetical protein ACAI25_01555 [Planctomycetota bacterium]